MTDEEKIGDLINKYNNLELLINHVISNYFSPNKNEKDFHEILLNGTVIGMGQKIKILANMTGFDNNKSIHNLGEILRIRNAVVHNNPYVIIDPNMNPDEHISYKHMQRKLDVMNSSGKIKTKDFDEEYLRFNELLDSVVPNIQKFNLSITHL
ncbi:hypothetical protein [Salinimicrobium xinjiangense]|uniref:hypothetical protein n=1 Tax=Salinimicrobium xinjiangense TaxID=438596 RepID=UPI0004011D29|nr:hypothetical protein [Salinimicrobium xinjiangense]